MLVSSTGGLLFVFYRNSAFLALFLILIFSFFYLDVKIKKSIYYPAVLTLFTVLFLFAANFIFAINTQSLNTYSAFGNKYKNDKEFFYILKKHPAFGEFIASKFYKEYVELHQS